MTRLAPTEIDREMAAQIRHSTAFCSFTTDASLHGLPDRSYRTRSRSKSSFSSNGATRKSRFRNTGPKSSTLTFTEPELCLHRHAFQLCATADSVEAETLKTDYRERQPREINVLVVGSTGYIGKFVVKELIQRGYNVVAFAREKSGIGGAASAKQTEQDFEGAEVRFGDVTSLDSLRSAAFKSPVDVVVSCLASRTGGKSDSWMIDYEATLKTLQVARESGTSHFILLSAICVQKPLLEFQRAKLKFEAALQDAGDITYSIIRPTAFFKSLGGQVESVKNGGPYVMFGDGCLTACKPISEADLASFIADAVTQRDMMNKMLPIGGPGDALTPLQQAGLIFKHTGKKEKTLAVPVGLMDAIISVFEFLERFFPKLEDTVEFARIGRYYATESMLLWDAEKQEYNAEMTPSYGSDTLDAFFKKAVEEGLKGQELGDQAVFGAGK